MKISLAVPIGTAFIPSHMNTPVFTGYDVLIAVTIASGFTAAVLTFLFEWYHHAKRTQEWKERQDHWKKRKNYIMGNDEEGFF